MKKKQFCDGHFNHLSEFDRQWLLNLCHQIIIRAFGKIQRWQKGSLGNDDMNCINAKACFKIIKVKNIIE